MFPHLQMQRSLYETLRKIGNAIVIRRQWGMSFAKNANASHDPDTRSTQGRRWVEKRNWPVLRISPSRLRERERRRRRRVSADAAGTVLLRLSSR